MTEADLQLIERELAITLPESYRRAVVPFRVPALAGNTDAELWDDARALVTLNRELRAGSRNRPTWPLHLFAIGDPRGDELFAIDLRTAEAPVWWLDHGMVNSQSSYQSHEEFAEWAEEFYRDTRSDLEGDGFNPDATPAVLDAARSSEAKKSFLGCFVIASIIAVAITWFFYLRR
jgi:hypothetical protein